MTRGEGACLVCGKPIIYFDKAKKMKCIMCHKTFESYASCEDGHFVCDECHAKKGIDMVMEECKNSTSKNPIVLLQKLMAVSYTHLKDVQAWAEEIETFKNIVEEFTGNKVTADKLAESIKLINNKRKALERLYDLRKNETLPISRCV